MATPRQSDHLRLLALLALPAMATAFAAGAAPTWPLTLAAILGAFGLLWGALVLAMGRGNDTVPGAFGAAVTRALLGWWLTGVVTGIVGGLYPQWLFGLLYARSPLVTASVLLGVAAALVQARRAVRHASAEGKSVEDQTFFVPVPPDIGSVRQAESSLPDAGRLPGRLQTAGRIAATVAYFALVGALGAWGTALAWDARLDDGMRALIAFQRGRFASSPMTDAGSGLAVGVMVGLWAGLRLHAIRAATWFVGDRGAALVTASPWRAPTASVLLPFEAIAHAFLREEDRGSKRRVTAEWVRPNGTRVIIKAKERTDRSAEPGGTAAFARAATAAWTDFRLARAQRTLADDGAEIFPLAEGRGRLTVTSGEVVLERDGHTSRAPTATVTTTVENGLLTIYGLRRDGDPSALAIDTLEVTAVADAVVLTALLGDVASGSRKPEEAVAP